MHRLENATIANTSLIFFGGPMRPIEYIIHLVWDHSARVIMMSVVTTASSFALGGTKTERLCISWESHC